MLFQILNNYGFSKEGLAMLVLMIPCVLLALTVHEAAHGFAAYKLGDMTARNEGRLSLNPLAHLDPIGTIMMLLVGFGWAKPVPINSRYFKKPKRDIAITAVAGPFANLVTAFVATLLGAAVLRFMPGEVWMDYWHGGKLSILILVYTFFDMLAKLNIGLAVFNLIPLPPLDGSNILVAFLPPKAASQYLKVRYYTRYIFLGLIVLSYLADYSILFAQIDYYLWWPVTVGRDWILYGMNWVAEQIFFGLLG